MMDQNIFRKFVDWTKLKLKIHALDEIPFYFYERDVWWASIGQNIGSEENGKHSNFERPLLILKKFNKDMFLGIPVSSNIKTDQYHYVFEIEGKQHCLILSQMRLFSSKRLLRNVGKMADIDFDSVREAIKRLI